MEDIIELQTDEDESSLDRLARHRERPALRLSCDMDWTCVDAVRRISEQLEGVGELSVLLDSSGGDIECAYRSILALRDVVDDIEVLVPGWAKSAATFFCLAADSIHIGRYGELGPLDPQMLDRTGSARRVSALESSKALDRLLNYSLESLDGIVLFLLDRTHMDIPQAIENSQPLFASIASSLYSQVDPRELGEATRSLSISEEYAVRVMQRWGYQELDEGKIRGIARRLVWDYPTHGFVIDLEEAREIGLTAERLDETSDIISRAILDDPGPFIEISSLTIGETGLSPSSHIDSTSLMEGMNNVESAREEIAE